MTVHSLHALSSLITDSFSCETSNTNALCSARRYDQQGTLRELTYGYIVSRQIRRQLYQILADFQNYVVCVDWRYFNEIVECQWYEHSEIRTPRRCLGLQWSKASPQMTDSNVRSQLSWRRTRGLVSCPLT